ncbi:MAG: group II truncated hemoglobin [Bdellovibrio sp.]
MSEQEKTIYEMLGGEQAVRNITKRFYEVMDAMPESQGIRKMHPQNIKTSEDKLFMFLSGWLGGPQLFVEKFGHPRLRARHLPFAIGKSERDQWMLCMVQTFDDLRIEEPIRSELLHALLNLADHMRNKTEPE